MNPPVAKKIPCSLTLHGETRTDNYHWMRDDQRENPEILDWLQQENAWGDVNMASHQALQAHIRQEIIDRIPQQEWSVPWVKRGWRYQTRYEEGDEYPRYWRQPEAQSGDDQWQLLLDGNQRAEGHSFYGLGALAVSPDNHYMAVAEDVVSRRQYTIRFRDLISGDWLPDVLSNVSASISWASDSRTLYYVKKHPQTLLPCQVWRHRLGSSFGDDQLVYEEQDDTFYLSLAKTTSEQYILIMLESTTTSEIILLDAGVENAQPDVFVPRRRDHEYTLDHYRQRFYIRSNRNGKNFGLFQSEVADEAGWQTLIAAQDEVVLEDFQLFRDWLVVEERDKGLTRLRQIHWQRGESREIIFDDPAYVSWLDHNPSPETSQLRYGYSSMTTPPTRFELDMESGVRNILKQQTVKHFNGEDYHSERLWVTVRDGTQVPVSLVWNRHQLQAGVNPMLVYGYGAYGSSMEASFSASRLSLLDRGFIFALVHVRGGGELGQAWHDQGRTRHKQNTFSDFIDVTDALVAQGYGDPRRLYAMGGSAGGLLMGAVINQAPDRFHGVIAQVPFVDVLTTMLDASIPLTTGEYDEWGNPGTAQDYHRIRQYSPYDNVAPRDYPHLLVTTGLHDSQVQYWEPAKWVAKLRELKTDDNLLLLFTDMEVGHGGKSGRFAGWDEVARSYTFLLGLAAGSLPADRFTLPADDE